jgi:mannonate dehydratase
MRPTLGMGRSPDADDNLTFMKQIGVEGVLIGPPVDPKKGYYEYPVLLNMKAQIEGRGLKCEGTSLLPWGMCYKWMLGLPGRDEQIENLQKTLRNMGAAGIPFMVYNMHAIRFYRTNRGKLSRGGALGSAFESERVKDAPLMTSPGIDDSLIPESHRKPITDDQMWDNLEYFLKAVVPVAEEAGVCLALHPDDPPVPEIAGVARIMREPEAFQRAIDTVPSDYNGLKFCTGCFSEMGVDVPKWIRHFTEQKKIFLIDFRNISGVTDDFTEAFPDDGNEKMFECMRALKDSGYDGPIHPDHAMHITGDSNTRQYWSYAIGHMRGLIEGLA